MPIAMYQVYPTCGHRFLPCPNRFCDPAKSEDLSAWLCHCRAQYLRGCLPCKVFVQSTLPKESISMVQKYIFNLEGCRKRGCGLAFLIPKKTFDFGLAPLPLTLHRSLTSRSCSTGCSAGWSLGASSGYIPFLPSPSDTLFLASFRWYVMILLHSRRFQLLDCDNIQIGLHAFAIPICSDFMFNHRVEEVTRMVMKCYGVL